MCLKKKHLGYILMLKKYQNIAISLIGCPKKYTSSTALHIFREKRNYFLWRYRCEKGAKEGGGYLLQRSEMRAGFVKSTLTPFPGREGRIRTTPSQHLYHKGVGGSGGNPPYLSCNLKMVPAQPVWGGVTLKQSLMGRRTGRMRRGRK